MQTVIDKSVQVMAQVAWERQELAGIHDAEALVARLERQPRPAYQVELTQKATVLAFLTEHYAQWRAFDVTEAERLVAELPENPQAARGVGALGIAWWATGDPRYGAAFDRLFRENATGTIMPDWCFRALAASSDLQAYLLLQDCPALTLAGRIAFLDHLLAMCNGAFDEVLMGYRHRDLGTGGHNYWVNSATALPEVGVLYPEFTRADFFLRTGVSVMEEHLRNNYKADGGSRETAFAYQVHEMTLLWTLLMLLERNGVACSRAYRERVYANTRFLLQLMTPQGGLPKYGDMSHVPGGLTQLTAIATAATGDGELKWYAEYCRRMLAGAEQDTPGVLPYCAFWNCGLAGARVYAQTRAQAPKCTSVLLAPTGIAVLRDSAAPDASYLSIIAAERGPIVTSHGHSDVFSLDIHAGGERFIGEPSCKLYGYSAGRQYELSTASKSTVTVNGGNQVDMPEPFRFDGIVLPTVSRWISEPTHDFFHGAHEAYYRRETCGVLHERKVFFLKATAAQPAPGYWVVLDYLEAEQPHDYTIAFQGLQCGELDGLTARLCAPSGRGFAIVPPAEDLLTLELESSPARQAFLQEYGFAPAQYPCFTYRHHAADVCLLWVLTPLAAGQPAPTVRRLPVRLNAIDAPVLAATAVEIDFGAYRDLLCISHKEFDNQLDFAGESSWGNLAFRRLAADGTRLLALENRVLDGVCGR